MTVDVSALEREHADARITALSEAPLIPVNTQQGLWRGSLTSVQAVVNHRQLLGLLVHREVKVRYKDSVLGMLWTLLRPLALLVVYYVAIGKFLGAERSIPEFAIYVFTGLTVWQLFNDIVGGGTGSIVANSGLVKKIYVPREIFPLSVVGSALVSFAIQTGVLLAATVVAQSVPTGSRWWYAPLSLATVAIFGTALALALSAINVYLRDMQYLVEIVLMVLFWTTPTVYSWAQVSEVLASNPIARELYLANPATLAVMGFQQTFWVAGSDAPVPDHLAQRMLIACAIGLVLVWLAQRLFARLQGNFAQEL